MAERADPQESRRRFQTRRPPSIFPCRSRQFPIREIREIRGSSPLIPAFPRGVPSVPTGLFTLEFLRLIPLNSTWFHLIPLIAVGGGSLFRPSSQFQSCLIVLSFW